MAVASFLLAVSAALSFLHVHPVATANLFACLGSP